MNGNVGQYTSTSRQRLAVVHWFPLEQFPPVQNLLHVAAADRALQICCLTTANDRGQRAFSAGNVQIRRRPFPSKQRGRLTRLWLLLSFSWWCLIHLLRYRPHTLVYFEPHSSFAAFLYLLLARRCRLLIHYHEYREPREYQDPGNRLFGLYHRLERRFLYSKAVWISQTNADRVRLFLQDVPEVDSHRMRVLPNYPPARWQQFTRQPASPRMPLRLVYVGAASVRDTFIAEVVDWVRQQPDGTVTLTVYLSNSDQPTRQILQAANGCGVTVFPAGVEYTELPKVLTQYDVGLILYRGNTPNYVYNAPNKLFEYLVCGLDVWYPGCMLGIRPYATCQSSPQVLEVDFHQLPQSQVLQAMQAADLPVRPFRVACEDVLQALLDTVKQQGTGLDPRPTAPDPS
jgi:hypothetical protein